MRMSGRLAAAIVASAALMASVASPLTAQAPAPASAWKTAGSIDAGFVSATGNTELTTLSAGNTFSATIASWTFSQSLAYVYGKTSGKESANQLRIGMRTDVAATSKVGAFVAATFERNAYAGFNVRIEELLGVQWKLLADSADALTIDAGGLVTQQENTDGTSVRSPSAREAAAYKHTFKANTFFTQTIEHITKLDEGGAYRVNAESALVAPIAKSISLKLGYVVQFNSRPPVKFGSTDRVFTSGLQISF